MPLAAATVSLEQWMHFTRSDARMLDDREAVERNMKAVKQQKR